MASSSQEGEWERWSQAARKGGCVGFLFHQYGRLVMSKQLSHQDIRRYSGEGVTNIL